MRCVWLSFVALFLFAGNLYADDSRFSYSEVSLSEYVSANQISETMIRKKQRLMKQPAAIRFKGWAKSDPQPGKFELVYDALSLWASDSELPEVNFSAFVTAENSPVLSVYVTDSAAQQMSLIGAENQVTFYAVHIYTYAKGPRLVIVAAEADDGSSKLK